VVNERRRRIDAAGTAGFLAELGEIPIRIDRAPDSENVMALARKYGLTAYDAAYLELARRLGGAMATLDRALAAVAQAEGVELIGGGGN
jgi:predicted nucleic acid-binding protein